MASTAPTVTVPAHTATPATPTALPSTNSTAAKSKSSTKPKRDTLASLKVQNTEFAKELDELRASNAAKDLDLRKLSKFKVAYIRQNRPADSDTIPKPVGERGTGKNKGGWLLQEAMGLEDDKDEYNCIMRGIRSLIDTAGIDVGKPFKAQNHGRLQSVYTEAKRRHPFLNRFTGDWVAEEFVKANLRDRRKYINRIRAGKIKSQAKPKAGASKAASIDLESLSDLDAMDGDSNQGEMQLE